MKNTTLQMLSCDAERPQDSIYGISDFQRYNMKIKLFFIKRLIIQKIVVPLQPISMNNFEF